MLCVRAPRVKYEFVDKLVRLCFVVVEEYNDVLMQEIWNEQLVPYPFSSNI
jgi:hypothetical protein